MYYMKTIKIVVLSSINGILYEMKVILNSGRQFCGQRKECLN